MWQYVECIPSKAQSYPRLACMIEGCWLSLHCIPQVAWDQSISKKRNVLLTSSTAPLSPVSYSAHNLVSSEPTQLLYVSYFAGFNRWGPRERIRPGISQTSLLPISTPDLPQTLPCLVQAPPQYLSAGLLPAAAGIGCNHLYTASRKPPTIGAAQGVANSMVLWWIVRSAISSLDRAKRYPEQMHRISEAMLIKALLHSWLLEGYSGKGFSWSWQRSAKLSRVRGTCQLSFHSYSWLQSFVNEGPLSGRLESPRTQSNFLVLIQP